MQTQQAPLLHHPYALSVWRKQINEAIHAPTLRGRLMQRERELLPDFTSYYTKLQSLPRRMRRMLQRQWKQSLAGMALLLTLGQAPTLAATINVDDTARKSNNLNGVIPLCTLVDAITAANTDTATNGCPAGSGADTIVLPRASTQGLVRHNNFSSYANNGLPIISSVITIEGQGSTIERSSSAPDFRIFAINRTGNLTLRATTISGGKTGGFSSSGGGIHNHYGTLTLINSIVSYNYSRIGGGIRNESGRVMLTGSTVASNSASFGGGLNNFNGVLIITNSTIAENVASNYGGGITNTGGTGTLNLLNTTISGNSASTFGGGIYSHSTIKLTHSTVSGNSASERGGGMHNFYRTATLVNSLISGNSAPAGSEFYNKSSGTVVANNFNLFGQGEHAGVTGFVPGPRDIVPTVLLDAILDPMLAFNTGRTQTLALVTGSPAVDVVPSASCPATDQRRLTRPQGPGCDIGAFELVAPIRVVSGICTLVDAITAANTDTATNGCLAGNGADTIILPPDSVQTLTTVNNTPRFYGPSGLPIITSSITISGQGSTIRRDSGAPTFRILAVGETGDLTLQQTTVTGGSTSGGGGGIAVIDGTLTLINSTVSNNTAGGAGGLLGSGSEGLLTLIDSSVSNNTAATGVGGGIASGSPLTLTNSTVSGNVARQGGGISNFSNALFTLINSTISGNSAFDSGGGLESYFGYITLTNSTVSGNSARVGGGACNFGHLTLVNSTVSGNIASRGGGIFNISSPESGAPGILSLTNTLVSGNTASVSGQGIYNFFRYIYYGLGTGTVITDNFNIFGQDGNAGVIGFSPGAKDIIPSVPLSAIVDPLLASNGGPTQTHALIAGSPAMDAVTAAGCPATDQRGIGRPQGTACDIGAFELAIASPSILCSGASITIFGTTGNDDITGTPGRDVIHGLAGNDTLRGLGGDDVICGGIGNDTLVGGDGQDVLAGNDGADRLFGGTGNDRLAGNSGRDELFGGSGADLLFGGAGDDVLNGGADTDRCNGEAGVGDSAAFCETTLNVP